ncbi:S41 family peptidase [Thalassotalea fusca]
MTKLIHSSTHGIFKPLVSAIVFGLSINCTNVAANESGQIDKAFNSHNVVRAIADKLAQEYVFPEKGKQLSEQLLKHVEIEKFNSVTQGDEFARLLTEKLQELSQDKHLQVEYNAHPVPADDPNAEADKGAFELEMWQAQNFGFEKIERLPFNIGYFKLSAFGPTEHVGKLLASTMTLLSNSDALIIDLCGNFGGEEQTVQLLLSYFFEQPTHTLTMITPKENMAVQHWTTTYVEGPRYNENKEVIILVDKNTVSAAEDFSYAMKHFKRATIVGEQTGGAANSGDFVAITDHFSMFLPTARGVSPVTQTNWEKTGVTPDVKSTSDEALNEAQMQYLTNLLAKEASERRKQRISARLSSLKG